MHNAVIHLTRNLSEASPLWRYRGALAGQQAAAALHFCPASRAGREQFFSAFERLISRRGFCRRRAGCHVRSENLRCGFCADDAGEWVHHLPLHSPSIRVVGCVSLLFESNVTAAPAPRRRCPGYVQRAGFRLESDQCDNARICAEKGVPLRPSALLKETQAAQQVYDSTPFFLGKVLYPHRNFMPYLSFVAQHFAKGMLLSLPMYLQVSGLSGVLFSWKKLLGNPLSTLAPISL